MSTPPSEDPRNTCEIIVLRRMREALDEAYAQCGAREGSGSRSLGGFS